jgi:hypothetical protein
VFDLKTIKIIALLTLLIIMMAWGTLAIYFSSLPAPLRSGVAVLFVVTAIVLLLFLRPRRRGILAFLVIFSVILIGWLSMDPSNDRNWQPDVAVLPHATVDGDAVTVHNIRNCDYHTETDFSVHHYDKTFNLSGLRSFDIFLSDWELRTIVYTLDEPRQRSIINDRSRAADQDPDFSKLIRHGLPGMDLPSGS